MTSSPPRRVAVHTKALVGALGAERAMEVVAGTTGAAVLWAGHTTRDLHAALNAAHAAQVSVWAVALPKVRLSGPNARASIDEVVGIGRAAAEAGTTLVSLTASGGTIDSIVSLVAAVTGLGLRVALENSSSREDALSDLRLLARAASAVPQTQVALDLGHAQVANGTSNEAADDPVSALDWDTVQLNLAWIEAHANDGLVDEHLPLAAAGAKPLSLSAIPRAVLDSAAWVLESDPSKSAAATAEDFRHAYLSDLAVLDRLVESHVG